MNDETSTSLPRACVDARQTLQDLLDGPVDAPRQSSLDGHLVECSDCREVRDGLQAVRDGLRALPGVPFPDDALREVRARTLDATGAGLRGRVWRPAFGSVAALAASLLVVALIIVWDRTPEPVQQLSPEQLEQVRRDVRQVLELTAQALIRTELAAGERVIEDEVSPAIRKIRIQWPEEDPPDDRRSKT